jgi:hypothetical protein
VEGQFLVSLGNEEMPNGKTLRDGLKRRTYNTLARNGLLTVEDVIAAYPLRLLRLEGFGFSMLREVERLFLPEKCFAPEVNPRRVSYAQIQNHIHWSDPDIESISKAV